MKKSTLIISVILLIGIAVGAYIYNRPFVSSPSIQEPAPVNPTRETNSPKPTDAMMPSDTTWSMTWTMMNTWEMASTGSMKDTMKSQPTTTQPATAPTKPAATTTTKISFAGYKKPSDDVLKTKLTSTQYAVTQEDSTETPYQNKYRDNHEEGIYVDIVSWEPLFSSQDKYDSQTWRPSFTKPIDPTYIVYKTDSSFLETRTEVRSKYADSHLWHVFDDGPQPTWKRFCMNSASMRFIPVASLETEWHWQYTSLFMKK